MFCKQKDKAAFIKRPLAVVVALDEVCQTLVQVADNNVLHQ
jgi:hypothetical protein